MTGKKFSVFIIFMLIIANLAIASVAFGQGNQSNEVTVKIDEEAVAFPDEKPYIDAQNRVMVPVRFVSEALGAAVDWDDAAKQVTISQNAEQVVLTIDSKMVEVNGETKTLDTAAELSAANRVMVPVRFVSEFLGHAVDWDEQHQTVMITDNINQKAEEALQTDTDSTEDIETAEASVQIADAAPESPVYYQEEQLSARVTVENEGQAKKVVWLGHSLSDSLGEWHDVPAKRMALDAGEVKEVSLEWEVPGDIISGPYSGVFALWDHPPDDANASRLATLEKEDYVRLYNQVETFETFPEANWKERDDARLGRSALEAENVFIDNGALRIRHPAGTVQGGEIQTREPVHFGSYEAKLKLPNAPSSITGFFLYQPPDFYHEIDIEVFNEPSGNYLLTTYADGETKNTYEGTLPFDPTAGFNRYRIDYFPHAVAFYVNDQLIKQWEDGYSEEPMRLMVNSWFPNWLEGRSPGEDEFLKIDWIRY